MLNIGKKDFYIDILNRNGIKGEITDVDIVTPDLHGEHFASACISVTVHRKEGEPVELFVKTFTNNESHTEMLRNLGVFDKEAAFFNIILSELQKIIDQRPDTSVPCDLNVAPRCFYADGEMIIMENMAKKNYSLLDKVVGQNLEQAKLVLQNLAKLHSASYMLLSKFKNQADIFHKYPFLCDLMTSEQGANEMQNWMQPIYKLAIEVLQRGRQSEEVSFAVNWLNDAVEAGTAARLGEYIKEESGHICYVVNHGDCWNSNMLFQRDPVTKDIKNHVFVDFQVIRVGSPCLDIGYYMFTTVQRDVRKREWQTLLRHYYDHLIENVSILGGKIKFTFEELVEDFRRKFVVGFMVSVCMGGFLPAFSSIGDLNKIEGNILEAFSVAIGKWIQDNPVLAQDAAEGLLEDFVQYRELAGVSLS